MQKNSCKSIKTEIIEYFFSKSVDELKAGVRLNNSDEQPYVKKRLKGRGGFRIYYLLLIKNVNLYLMFVPLKTGSPGADNITDESNAYLYKKVLECIRSSELYKIELSGNERNLIFHRL
ncbi:hypothetical protein A8C56_12035 [Niabella ginsenosidivorans]|uniref:Uncharacterized protein n=1 Tax=Niabella ginsenosidivorans TaxID=1176587 RepID=A0A1A9I1S9_9BACT|nr:hypothetical protein A8C56_12035 [Niabella ginsenosidivorans]